MLETGAYFYLQSILRSWKTAAKALGSCFRKMRIPVFLLVLRCCTEFVQFLLKVIVMLRGFIDHLLKKEISQFMVRRHSPKETAFTEQAGDYADSS